MPVADIGLVLPSNVWQADLGQIATLQFWKFWNCSSKTRAISKIFKNQKDDLSQKLPESYSEYWLIVPNQETLCIETNIF